MQILEHQTIDELAVVDGTTWTLEAQQGTVTGPLYLTPIQHWFFEQNFSDPHYWNMAMLLEARQALHLPVLKKAALQLLVHHDALRLRFVREESGWRSFDADPDEAVPPTRVDLSGLAGSQP